MCMSVLAKSILMLQFARNSVQVNGVTPNALNPDNTANQGSATPGMIRVEL
jgi:hypothetical protein